MDHTLLNFFNQTLAHPTLDGLMLILTSVGLAALPALGLMLMVSKSQRRVGLAILLALCGGIILALIFQYLALRPRPDFARHLTPLPNFPSFPSGHATAAFSAALVIGLAYRRRIWWILGVGTAALIALSRVYLGVHYPSDIVGGAILGAAVGASCYGLIVSEKPLLERIQWLLWLQIAIAVLVSQMAYLAILPWNLLRWPLADKVLHFLLIGSIAFWLNLWLRGRTISIGKWAVPLAFLLPFTIALVEEIAQAFTPLRTADLGDLAGDVAGLIIFWWLSQKLLEAAEQRRSSLASIIQGSPPGCQQN